MNKFEMGQQVADNMSELDMMGKQYEQKWTAAWEAAGQNVLNIFRKPEDKIDTGYEQKRHEADEAARFYWDAVGSSVRGFFDPKWKKAHDEKFKDEYEKDKNTTGLKVDLKTEYPTDLDLICNEERYGLATPQFLKESGLAADFTTAINIAEALRKHPEKVNPVFLKSAMVKANDKKKTEDQVDLSKIDFQKMADAISGKKMEVKASPAPVMSTQEVSAAHPQPMVQPQTQNPMSPGFMAQFVQGIPLDTPQPQPFPQQEVPMGSGYNPYYAPAVPVIPVPQQPPVQGQPIPQQPQVPMQYDPPQYMMESQAMYGMVQPNPMIPMHGNQVMQNLKGNFNQPSPVAAPVTIVVKEREQKILQDDGAVLEGVIPTPEIKEPVKKVVPAVAITEKAEVVDDEFSIVRGEYPEVVDERIRNILKTLKSNGFLVMFRELKNVDGEPIGIYEFHPFVGDSEMIGMKFCVDTGMVFDRRMKFCIGPSSNFETKDWWPLEVNQGPKLVYFDEILKNFLRNGQKVLLGKGGQKPLYNKVWKTINREFLDLSSIPSEALTSTTRKVFNTRVSELFNCTELQMRIEEQCPNGTRFRVMDYDKDTKVFKLVNANVRDNILGRFRSDPAFLTIAYDGQIATLFSNRLDNEVKINVKLSATAD